MESVSVEKKMAWVQDVQPVELSEGGRGREALAPCFISSICTSPTGREAVRAAAALPPQSMRNLSIELKACNWGIVGEPVSCVDGP